MLVVDGVHLIENVKGANVYLVTGRHPFLVDTGLPRQEKKILGYLKNAGIESGALQGIILTHYDVDHVGSATALQRFLSCPIYAHPTEIPYITGTLPRPGIKKWLPLFVLPVFGRLVVPQEIKPLADEGVFMDWEIMHTPGHTPGHLVLYRNGIAIVGDLLQGGNIRPAPAIFTWNSEVLKKSIINLLTRPLRWILPGHGPATAASARWLEQIKKDLEL